MTAFTDQAATARDLCEVLTYTVDSGGHPWQIAGTPGRMSETEALHHLRVLHGAGNADALAAMDLVRVRAAAAAAQHLRVDHHADRFQLTTGGRRMGRAEAHRVLVSEYRLSPDEADSKLQAACRP